MQLLSPCRALALAALLGLALVARAPAQRRKSPAAAFGLAAVPGAIFHGAGNYYAGDRRTGAILFLSEVFGLALMSLDHRPQEVGQRIGNRDGGDGTLQGVGRVLFFGSWLYDMGSAPETARETNRRRYEKGFELGLDPPDPRGGSSFNPRAAYTVRF